MLISCYQCRQQLDVPDDSAGKRVRCPHCQYVIVAPAKAKAVEPDGPAGGGAAMALPSMELDGDADRPAATKVAPMPLPSYDPLPAQPTKPESRPSSQSDDDYPDLPSIDRGGRRRRPLTAPLPGTRYRWGKIIGIGAVVGVIVIGVILGIASSQNNRRRQQQPPMVFNNQQLPKPGIVQGGPNFINPQVNNGQVIVPQNLWQNIDRPDHRFKAQFPGKPAPVKLNIDQALMTTFEVQWKQGNVIFIGPNGQEQVQGQVPVWHFTVAHSTLTVDEFNRVPLHNRYARLKDALCKIHQTFPPGEGDTFLSNIHPGKEWTFVSQIDNSLLFARTYFIRDGERYHHFLLSVKVPANVQRHQADITRFFNSFAMLADDGFKQVVFAELDTPANGDRRDNEFTALAVHPKKAIAVTGSAAGTVTAVEAQRQRGFSPVDKKSIGQVAVSSDGDWIAVAVDKEIQVWNWSHEGEPLLVNPFALKLVVPGQRAVFAKNQRLLAATKTEVKEYAYDADGIKALEALPLPDLDVAGLALSADERTLAVFGGKALELWQWPEKKLLGRIEAHDAAITAVAFSLDGKTLASGSVDRTIKLWHVETRQERATLKQHAWTVAALAFTPDGKHLVSSGLDGMVLMWSLAQPQPQLVWAESHQFPVRAIAVDKEHLFWTCKRPHVAGAGAKQYARQVRKIAWADIKPNPQAALRLVAQQAGLHLPTTSVMSYFTPDNATFVTTTDGIDGGAQANSLRIWDTATATVKHTHSMQGAGVLSPDGKWFAHAKHNAINKMQLLDVQANRVFDVLTFVPQGVGVFPFVLFTPDSKALWVQRNHEFVRYEIQTPKNEKPKLVQQQALKLREPFDTRIVTIYPALDHQTFLVELRSADNVFRTRTQYASADGKLLPRPKAPFDAWSQHLSLRRMGGHQVELHDLVSSRSEAIGQQRQFMTVNPRTNTSIFAIQPDRKYAVCATMTNEQTVRLNFWDLQERRPLLTLPEARARVIQSLQFAPDGKHLAIVTGESWTRIVPTDWLLERKGLLPCPANDVAGP